MNERAHTLLATSASCLLHVDKLSLWYGSTRALRDVSLRIPVRKVTALIGPSGCGKSTLLRTLNRMNDEVPGVRYAGRVLLDGIDILRPDADVTALRMRVGMLFQRPNPFPLSIEENVVFGLRLRGASAAERRHALERTLHAVGLWDSLATRLHESALSLSAEQQQRVCLARALAMNPDVLLLDEPCSALDPHATAHIESLIIELSAQYTIVIVTHNLQQARRIADCSAYLLLGELIEVQPTQSLFTAPQDPRTADYVQGRYG